MTFQSCQHIDNPNRYTVLEDSQIQAVEAAYGLIQDFHSQILMIQLAGSGLLFFPGGKLEAEETWHQALIREVHEETQQQVRGSSIEFFYEHQSHLYHPQKELGFFCHAKYFTCQVNPSNLPLPCTPEGQAIWVGLSDLNLSQLSVNADFILLKWQLRVFKKKYNAYQK